MLLGIYGTLLRCITSLSFNFVALYVFLGVYFTASKGYGYIMCDFFMLASCFIRLEALGCRALQDITIRIVNAGTKIPYEQIKFETHRDRLRIEYEKAQMSAWHKEC